MLDDMKCYRQINSRDRRKIARLKSYKLSISEIARRTGFNKSTISRELRRNGCLQKVTGEKSYWMYTGRYSDVSARFRRAQSIKRERVIQSTREWIIEKIKKDWSPQQIAGHLSLHGPERVSHEYIYKLIIKDKRRGGKLYKKLKRFGRRKKRTGERNYNKVVIPHRVPIEDRPRCVELRARLGDLEGDFIVGKDNKSYILTLVDRKSRQIVLEKLTNRKKILVESAILKAFKRFPKVHTLTLDNAREFSCHLSITKKTGVRVYFANPYASYERGSIENANGILRYYYPKRTDFRAIKETSLRRLEKDLNCRPRKVLEYLTSMEVIKKCIKKPFTPYK